MALVAPSLARAAVECARPRLIEPGTETVEAVRRRIAWAEVAGATGYRVRILSRVPEGEQIVALDLRTRDAALVPPRPLARERALVRVSVAALCASGSEAPPDAGQVFAIDATGGGWR